MSVWREKQKEVELRNDSWVVSLDSIKAHTTSKEIAQRADDLVNALFIARNSKSTELKGKIYKAVREFLETTK